MGRESSQWQTLRDRLFNPKNMHAVRVENSCELGTPDVNWSGFGAEGWIELKAVDAWPKRNETPLRIDHYTKQQRLWARQRHLAGGRIHLLLKVRREWLLFHGVTAADILGHSDQATTRAHALVVMERLEPDHLLNELLSKPRLR